MLEDAAWVEPEEGDEAVAAGEEEVAEPEDEEEEEAEEVLEEVEEEVMPDVVELNTLRNKR